MRQIKARRTKDSGTVIIQVAIIGDLEDEEVFLEREVREAEDITMEMDQDRILTIRVRIQEIGREIIKTEDKGEKDEAEDVVREEMVIEANRTKEVTTLERPTIIIRTLILELVYIADMKTSQDANRSRT